MELHVNGKGMSLSSEIRARVQRRIGFALGRFESRIARVVVQLTELDGPGGGFDQRCSVRLSMRPRGELRIDVSDSVLESAVQRAMERAARRVASYIESQQTSARVSRTNPPGA